MLSSSKTMKDLTTEQQNLQKEFECLQTEHMQKMEELYNEQRDLEEKLKQVKKQKCLCDPSFERDKETQYANQVREQEKTTTIQKIPFYKAAIWLYRGQTAAFKNKNTPQKQLCAF